MPKIKVEIKWDRPKEKIWLNRFNIETALNNYCKNTKFEVQEIKGEKTNYQKHQEAVLRVKKDLEKHGAKVKRI